MQDYEKLGAFYLGRSYDLEQKAARDELVLYDSKDLLTHAVCVGMTGSGKTGLCVALIEEAAIDGIPAIVIDPKGDLANLRLTFPRLGAEDFLPWIDETDAQRQGRAPQDHAQAQAERWRAGLAEWGQDPARIQRLRDAAECVVYTPGSSAGTPVSILKPFAAPGRAVIEDGELLRERVSNTATSLLALLGISADPVRSREHILLSTLLHAAWSSGEDLDLAALIGQIQTPPVGKIGVLELESFYPAKDRFELVLSLNNLLAAPGFGAWLEGQPLDIASILHTPRGKPRIAIFSIAHLNDAERMFFVSLLLNQVLGWMRGQPGTSSLRAVLYMDEIAGYFPPVSNPPSKPPLMTLLKQARAYGLGVVLATQNPVDLDYKGLANAGTWFIGRLQTERDKARVLEGLEGAGTRLDRGEMESILAGLGNRAFLMHNVHDDTPQVFQTRWTLSYLRGPLTREQIKRLADSDSQPSVSAPSDSVSPAGAPVPAALPTMAPGGGAGPQRPALPPEVSQFFIPAHGDGALRYRPMVLAAAKLRFADAKAGLDFTRDAAFLTPIGDGAVPVSWEDAEACGVALSDLQKSPAGPAIYGDLPAPAAKAKSYDAWGKAFVAWLCGAQTLELLKSPSLKQVSAPGELEREFRVRLQQMAREARDERVEALRKKYAPKIAALNERLRRAQQAVEREQAQAKQAQFQTAVSVGATLLGAFTGRKALGSATIGRAATAARGASRAAKERQDIGRAEDTVEAVQQQLADLDARFKEETAALQSRIDPAVESLETLTLKPKKTNIAVQLVALVWAPYRQDEQGQLTPAFGDSG